MRIDWNMAGFRNIRYGAAARGLCEQHGRRILNQANSTLKHGHKGYKMSSRAGRRNPQGRWRVTVAAVTPYGKRSNAIHNTLIKSL